MNACETRELYTLHLICTVYIDGAAVDLTSVGWAKIIIWNGGGVRALAAKHVLLMHNTSWSHNHNLRITQQVQMYYKYQMAYLCTCMSLSNKRVHFNVQSIVVFFKIELVPTLGFRKKRKSVCLSVPLISRVCLNPVYCWKSSLAVSSRDRNYQNEKHQSANPRRRLYKAPCGKWRH